MHHREIIFHFHNTIERSCMFSHTLLACELMKVRCAYLSFWIYLQNCSLLYTCIAIALDSIQCTSIYSLDVLTAC